MDSWGTNEPPTYPTCGEQRTGRQYGKNSQQLVHCLPAGILNRVPWKRKVCAHLNDCKGQTVCPQLNIAEFLWIFFIVPLITSN